MQKISQYKKDHVNYKINNFKKLDTFETFKVVDDKNCKLGKWIVSQEQQGKNFTQAPVWGKLKEVHAHVHGGVQSYIDKNATKASNDELGIIAKDIENDTVKVFDRLNGLLNINCNKNKS